MNSSAEPLPAGTPFIDVNQYRFPSERETLLLARIVVDISLFILLIILLFKPFLIFLFVGFFWFADRTREAMFIGHAVEITPNHYPEIHQRMRYIQSMLRADDIKIRIFVLPSDDDNIHMERFIGKRMLVLKSKLIEDLPSEEAVIELDYLYCEIH